MGNRGMETEMGESNDSSSKLSGPYVGLRPFERKEKGIFFGRNQDAEILVNKIFSARFTLFYSQSGLGKSSVLRALVNPELEDDGAVVVYFDGWSGEKPVADLKAKLMQKARDLGIADPDAVVPTLLELCRLITRLKDKMLVLVLDQFEEFLMYHAEDLNALRSELAALTQDAAQNVRVVISLREEFLAALDPFREEILNLFECRYRLESLKDDDVGLAIKRPAELFNAEFEEKLVGDLVKDLRSDSSDLGKRNGESSAPCSLPLMQIVCAELWKEAKRTGLPLTCDLYERLHYRKGILDSYVLKVMPRGWWRWLPKALTAQLLLYLAPKSGMKLSFSADDLESMTQKNRHKAEAFFVYIGRVISRLKLLILPQKIITMRYRSKDLCSTNSYNTRRIENELIRLEESRILRPRDFGSGKRFELEHDAFIEVLSPWRESVLGRWAFVCNCLSYCFFAFLAIVVLVVCVNWIETYRREITANRANGYSALTQGKYDKAKKHFDSADTGRSRWPMKYFVDKIDHAAIKDGLGQTYLYFRDFDNAKMAFKEAVKLAKSENADNLISYNLDLAESYIALRDDNNATIIYNSVLKELDGKKKINDANTSVLAQQNVLELDPLFARAYFGLANCLSGQKHYEDAIEKYKKSMEHSLRLVAGVGNCLSKLASVSNVLDHPNFEESIVLNERLKNRKMNADVDLQIPIPTYIDALLNLAYAQFWTGNREEAIKNFDDAESMLQRNQNAKSSISGDLQVYLNSVLRDK